MKLLVIVDYQNDFVDGALGFEGADSIDRKIAHKIRDYRKEDGQVVYTMATNQEDYLETKEGAKLPVEHCVEDTQGHRLFGFTAKEKKEGKDGDKVFYKDTLGALELADYVKFRSYDAVELVGMNSNMRVLANAVLLKAALPETDVIVNEEYIVCNDEALGAKSLDVMEALHVNVVRA